MTPIALPRATPETLGIPSAAIAEFVDKAESTLHSLHSFMLLRHGAVAAEGWWHPYRPKAPHRLFSLSKSFTSTAVGLALAEGRLTLDDPVLKFFPADAPRKVSANLAAMKVRHLLSMATGHDLDTTDRIMHRRNPSRAFLALPVEHAPGAHFVYNSGASFMLSAIMQTLTGQTLLDYLTPRLFAPLGVEGATWESHPNGVNFGGWGLNITTEDIARFGQLYLQNGLWQGQPLVPAAWIQAATARQVANGDDPQSDWNQGYGYQFWRCRHNIYRGDGAFGQFCIVMPDQEAVLVITAGLPDMQAVLNVAWETLLPAMKSEALPANEAAAGALAQSLSALRLTPPAGEVASLTAARVAGQTFHFERNSESLKSLTFDFGPQVGTLTCRQWGGNGWRRGTHTLTFGYGQWVEGLDTTRVPGPARVAASGLWTTEDTFTLTLCAYETPFTATLQVRFVQEEVSYQYKTNVGPESAERPWLVGTKQGP
jgi:CubicO group peptidase (beta-lactamase class C family)